MEKMFSIVMPVWNRANIVSRAIESVLAQDFKDYELLIIDDGSEDDLKEFVRPYLSENVIYQKITHSGASAARNFAFKLTKGKYIAYLDSDNVWHSDFLSKMHKVISGIALHKDVVHCRCNIYKKNLKSGKIYLSHIIGSKFDFKKVLRSNYIDINTVVHLKRCIESVGFFDEKLKRCTDWEFILRLATKYSFTFIKDILVDYYLNIEKNTLTSTEDQREPYKVMQKRYMNFYKQKVFVWHDAIKYEWDKVSDKKYSNWIDMRADLMYSDCFDISNLDTSDFSVRGYPYLLQIEPTNMCNLSCSLCPAAAGKNELKREHRHMKLEEFKSVIDAMRTYLLLVVLWDWGEPFMNPDLPGMIRYASERDIKVVTSTNAHFLHNNEYVERILRSGLATLIVAIDSINDERYKVYRGGGNVKEAISGLKNLLELKKKLKSNTLINLRMVIMKSNEHEVSKMREFARRLKVDKFTVKTANPSHGLSSRDSDIVPDNPKYRRFVYKAGSYERIRINAPCRSVWWLSNIHSNGNVVPCTYDCCGDMKVGNVFEKSFSKIWNDSAYRELRKKIYYEKDSIPMCRDCPVSSFKLSESRVIAESYYFNLGVTEAIVAYSKRIAKRWLPEKIKRAIVARIY